MRLNKHYELEGQHAFLAPSSPSWINYDEDKLATTWKTKQKALLGDRLHLLAAELIELGIKLPDNNKTMNMYVNDAIGYRMTAEQKLAYSRNIFGTTDALSFRQNPLTMLMLLRIHDLKTGLTRTSIDQLKIYAAIFCLEYEQNPFDIEIELRIYKGDDIEIHVPDPDEIMHIMEKIKRFDELIELYKVEARD